MPEVLRSPLRMDCKGIDLVSPLDRVPAGYFPYLQNVRVVSEGRIDARPGYVAVTNSESGSSGLHSIRRLNDEDADLAPNGYIYIAGDGTELVAGDATAPLPVIDTGYSGDPLSLIAFRPDVSPEAWMYVYDRAKMTKVDPAKNVKPIGTPPPGGIGDTSADYGPPAWVQVDDGQDSSGWVASGAALSTVDRFVPAGSIVIANIFYNLGSTGWACLWPSFGLGGSTPPETVGQRMQVILNAGAGNQETVVIKEVHPPITKPGSPTSIQGIKYDSGTTGLCTMVLVAQPVSASQVTTVSATAAGDVSTQTQTVSEATGFAGLTRNSLLNLNNGGGNAEVVRVLSVSRSPDGTTYSLRCITLNTHVIGETVDGEWSWYVYTIQTHAVGETVTSNYVQAVASGGGVASYSLTKTTAVNASTANNRPITQEDYFHLSIWTGTVSNLSYIRVRIYLSPSLNDYYELIISPNSLNRGWTEIVQPIANMQRFGQTTWATLASITSIEFFVQQSDLSDVGFDWFYFFGTYGPFVDPGSPVGLLYQSRFRDSSTGTASVPGPQTRYELFPVREQVVITPPTTAAAYIDKIDLYRQGSTLIAFTYVGTVDNNNAAPNVYSDNLPDTNIQANPVADYTLIQPWPVQDLPWKGVVSVVGTTVTWVSGTQFKAALLSNQVILVGGVAYQTYSQPDSPTQLQIFASAGVQTSVPYEIASPTLAGQVLPIAFGPLEGPLAPVVFAVGDPLNPGTLYYSNSANPDGASDQNTLELCPPSEALITGAVWNGLVFVGSRDTIFLVRYSYLQTLGEPGPVTFQFSKLPSPSGMWAPWAICAGQDGVYFLGRDGIYRATEQGVVSITDATLYPLFWHDGQNGHTTNNLRPINMVNLQALRLSAADNDVYFDYAAVGD